MPTDATFQRQVLHLHIKLEGKALETSFSAFLGLPISSLEKSRDAENIRDEGVVVFSVYCFISKSQDREMPSLQFGERLP